MSARKGKNAKWGTDLNDLRASPKGLWRVEKGGKKDFRGKGGKTQMASDNRPFDHKEKGKAFGETPSNSRQTAAKIRLLAKA